MKTPYVKEFAANLEVHTSFVVTAKEIRQNKKGEQYLSVILSDRTGEIDGRMFDNIQEVVEGFDRDDFVRVKGLVQVYHNRPQLTIHKLRRLDASEVDFADYFPASQRDPLEMWAELRGHVARMTDPHLKRLVNALLDDEEIARRFRAAPAAKHIHHAFLGGLLEHVVSLASLARMAAGHYKFVDPDLLLAGVVLHDIGKIYELSYERGFGYTAEGQLLGHMTIALHMVADKLPPGFPPRLRSLVEHMIISHHGRLEFGSPKLPQFPEALLLHYLDDMDSKMECMRALIDGDRTVDGLFTSFSPSLERVVLKKAKYLPEPAPAPPLPVAHPLFACAPKTNSPLGDKLSAALQTAEPSPEK